MTGVQTCALPISRFARFTLKTTKHNVRNTQPEDKHTHYPYVVNYWSRLSDLRKRSRRRQQHGALPEAWCDQSALCLCLRPAHQPSGPPAKVETPSVSQDPVTALKCSNNVGEIETNNVCVVHTRRLAPSEGWGGGAGGARGGEG